MSPSPAATQEPCSLATGATAPSARPVAVARQRRQTAASPSPAAMGERCSWATEMTAPTARAAPGVLQQRPTVASPSPGDAGAVFLGNGADGANGTSGTNGSGCAATAAEDGGVSITCGDAGAVFLANGAGGTTGANGTNGSGCTAMEADGGVSIACGDAGAVFLADGANRTNGTNGADAALKALILSTPPASSDSAEATFGFDCTAVTCAFMCSLDGAPSSPCTSPQTYTGLAAASHTFSVTARNTTDGASATSEPATYTWTSQVPPPAFQLQTSLTNIQPGQQPELQVVANDGAAHASWTYSWSDGQSGSLVGNFVPMTSANNGTVLYSPAYCALLGNGTIPLAIQVTVTDTTTSLSTSAWVSLEVLCPTIVNLTTETLYQPQQNMNSYQAPPAGFTPVYTQLIARHGARGMSSEGSDIAVYDMWLQAQAQGALTLGQQLHSGCPEVHSGQYRARCQRFGHHRSWLWQPHRTWRCRASTVGDSIDATPPELLPTSGRERPTSRCADLGRNRAYDSSRYFVGALTATNSLLSSLVTYPTVGGPASGYGTKPKAELPVQPV